MVVRSGCAAHDQCAAGRGGGGGWNIAELEKKVLASGSTFAKHLSEIQSELSELVQPTVYNLPNVLMYCVTCQKMITRSQHEYG
eukprot:COSAG01_NODE_12093_length_1802_cov_5.812096_2_plen_84_part_00